MRTSAINNPCPHCGAKNDLVTDPAGMSRPKPGDIGICVTCYALYRFDVGLQTRTLTLVEYAALKASSNWPKVMAYQRNLIRSKAARTAGRDSPGEVTSE